MNNKISIIVPVYNAEKYLCRCMDSVLNQTYRNLEIILIDDGSTDNSGRICDEYSDKDRRVQVIHKINGGVSSARNTGLQVADGDYIGFVDSDDWINPEMFDILLHDLLTTNSDISVCSFCNSQADCCSTHYMNEIQKPENMTSQELLSRVFLKNDIKGFMWNKLFKREIFNRIQFNEDAVIGEDLQVLGEILIRDYKCVYCPQKLYCYFNHQGSATSQIDCLFNECGKLRYCQVSEQLKKICANNNFILSCIDIESVNDIRDTLSLMQASGETKSIRFLKLKSDFKQYRKFYIGCRQVSLKNKLLYFLMYFSPWIYRKIYEFAKHL